MVQKMKRAEKSTPPPEGKNKSTTHRSAWQHQPQIIMPGLFLGLSTAIRPRGVKTHYTNFSTEARALSRLILKVISPTLYFM
jgi:hypothetical protein